MFKFFCRFKTKLKFFCFKTKKFCNNKLFSEVTNTPEQNLFSMEELRFNSFFKEIQRSKNFRKNSKTVQFDKIFESFMNESKNSSKIFEKTITTTEIEDLETFL